MNEPGIRRDSGERLLAYVLDGVIALPGDDLPDWLGGALGRSGRFAAFAEAHRDKIRKKLRVATEAGARGDVRAELETAFLLLADRRIELAFEAYGSGKKGPDFTVTFRASHRFNLEVTRPRVRVEGGEAQGAIGNAVLAKLRQLPGDAPNAVFVATPLAASAEEVGAALRVLKLRADRREEQFFAGRGLSSAEFQRQYRRLTAVFVAASGGGVHSWTNPEAPRQLPAGAGAALAACLAKGDWGG